MIKEAIEKVTDYINNLPEEEVISIINNDIIVISTKEYNQLLEDSGFLKCLEEQGVDNWNPGYEDACKDFKSENDISER